MGSVNALENINPTNQIYGVSPITRGTPVQALSKNGVENASNVDGTAGKKEQENFIVPKDQRSEKLEGMFNEKVLKQMGVIECATCASRRYQDESDDAGVSFQSPTHLNPQEAGSAVMSHEQEHVTREQARAEEEGKEVVSQSVQIHRDICPECGRSYVSGGVTRTTTATKDNPYAPVNDTNSEGNLLDVSL